MCSSVVKITTLRDLVLVPLLVGAVLLASCDGSNNSSSPATEPEPEPKPSSGKMDVLVFQAECCEGDAVENRKGRLYKVTRLGESIPLSDAAGLENVIDYAVSPDRELVAYWYSLDSGQTALTILRLEPVKLEVNALVEGTIAAVDWLQDSQGITYRVYDSESHLFALFLAHLGEASARILFLRTGAEARYGFSVSADGTRFAVLSEEGLVEAYPYLVPTSASLYWASVAAPEELNLIDAVSEYANTFNFNWSPYANELLYQRRWIVPQFIRFQKWNTATGPLLLLESNGISIPVLGQEESIEGNNWTTWLDAERILYSSAGGGNFFILGTHGNLRVKREAQYGRRVLPSPDNRRLAFVDSLPGSGVSEVYVMDLNNYESLPVGPAHVYNPFNLCCDISHLIWSAGSNLLAWNLQPSMEYSGDGELYIHEFRTSRTQLITKNLDGAGFGFPSLAGENLISYIEREGEEFRLIVFDLKARRTRFIGDRGLGSWFREECIYQSFWRTKDEILWNCTSSTSSAGIYLSQIDANGNATTTTLVDSDISYLLTLTENSEFVLIQPLQGDSNWLMYDFAKSQLVELQETRGYKRFTLLQ